MPFLDRIRREDGFTLVEVLSVCAVLAALSAIALVAFGGRDKYGLDAEAKGNARALLGKVHMCFIATEDYTLCDEPTEQEPPPGVVWGDGPGEVEVRRGDPHTTRYKVTIRATSRSQSNGGRHLFTIVKQAGEDDLRICETGGSNGDGGCKSGGW